MRKTLVVIGLLALSQAAMAQTPAPAGGGQSAANLPACSAADAQRVRNGESPSTPCKAEPASGSTASGGSSSSTSAPAGGATPAR
jgi:hypothetical protein